MAMPMRGCIQCGDATGGQRRTCSDDCEAEARAAQDQSAWEGGGVRALAALRSAGIEPLGKAARARLGARQVVRRHEENTWNAGHPGRADQAAFQREVLPRIQNVPLRELARRTGLSVAYCARIRRGEEVPHRRWWRLLLEWE